MFRGRCGVCSWHLTAPEPQALTLNSSAETYLLAAPFAREQLLRRPIELCNSTEDSLRHLKNALGYLEATARNNNPGGLMAGSVSSSANNAATSGIGAAGAVAAANNNSCGGAANQTNNINNTNDDCGRLLAPQNAQNASKRFSYFRRVTSAAAQREPRGRQTGSVSSV